MSRCLRSRDLIFILFYYYVYLLYIIKCIFYRSITEGNNAETANVLFILWLDQVEMEKHTLKSPTVGDNKITIIDEDKKTIETRKIHRE